MFFKPHMVKHPCFAAPISNGLIEKYKDELHLLFECKLRDATKFLKFSQFLGIQLPSASFAAFLNWTNISVCYKKLLWKKFSWRKPPLRHHHHDTQQPQMPSDGSAVRHGPELFINVNNFGYSISSFERCCSNTLRGQRGWATYGTGLTLMQRFWLDVTE